MRIIHALVSQVIMTVVLSLMLLNVGKAQQNDATDATYPTPKASASVCPGGRYAGVSILYVVGCVTSGSSVEDDAVRYCKG